MTPLVKEVTVAAPVDRAWRVFTDEIASWWPTDTHTVAPERVRAVVFEPRPGGRIFERWDDGTEHDWGEVTECEAPHRVRFSWRPNHDRPAATEVEITFTPAGDGTTVRLEHRAWERLGDEGAESRADYEIGWDHVLDRYANRV